MEIICETEEDYKFAVTVIAIAAALTGVKILTFQVMSNHIHVIVDGLESMCKDFFSEVKRRLRRYRNSSGRFASFEKFEASFIPIDNLRSMRYEIAYSNRNGYLANPSCTPFSYPWGAGYLYFNPHAFVTDAVPFGDLTRDEKLKMCRSRIPDLPAGYMVKDGLILPQSFCAIKYGESLFRDAHQYFSIVSKNYEAYSEIAKRLGDDVFLTDDEMFAALSMLAKKKYGDGRVTLLPNASKIELAKTMRSDYNASEGQIQRMLRLDRGTVSELFGHRT
jgi:REP element-mobilizing transposase RayT